MDTVAAAVPVEEAPTEAFGPLLAVRSVRKAEVMRGPAAVAAARQLGGVAREAAAGTGLSTFFSASLGGVSVGVVDVSLSFSFSSFTDDSPSESSSDDVLSRLSRCEDLPLADGCSGFFLGPRLYVAASLSRLVDIKQGYHNVNVDFNHKREVSLSSNTVRDV